MNQQRYPLHQTTFGPTEKKIFGHYQEFSYRTRMLTLRILSKLYKVWPFQFVNLKTHLEQMKVCVLFVVFCVCHCHLEMTTLSYILNAWLDLIRQCIFMIVDTVIMYHRVSDLYRFLFLIGCFLFRLFFFWSIDFTTLINRDALIGFHLTFHHRHV